MRPDRSTGASEFIGHSPVDSVFISHSTSDRYFVNLLVALLEYHGIESWYSQNSIKAGEHFKTEIKEALGKSDALLVIVTQNAAKSKWVTKEIVSFQTSRPTAPLIPVLLEKVPAEAVLEELGEYQWIDFTENMLAGFQKLIALFDRSFLPDPRTAMRERRSSERRRGDDRREQRNRRSPVDRRQSSLIQRMRIGFWKALARSTRMGEFDQVHFTVRMKFKVVDSLKAEVGNYLFSDVSGSSLDGVELLERTVDQIWKELGSRMSIKAVYLTEAIAEDLFHNYNVVRAERRTDERRTTERRGSERRELN